MKSAAHGFSTLARLGLATGAGLGMSVLAAIILAVLDLWVTGHGQPSLLRPWIDLPRAGVHLSRGDIGMLLVSCLAGLGTWFAVSGRS
jgi:hypothetical protein